MKNLIIIVTFTLFFVTILNCNDKDQNKLLCYSNIYIYLEPCNDLLDLGGVSQGETRYLGDYETLTFKIVAEAGEYVNICAGIVLIDNGVSITGEWLTKKGYYGNWNNNGDIPVSGIISKTLKIPNDGKVYLKLKIKTLKASSKAAYGDRFYDVTVKARYD